LGKEVRVSLCGRDDPEKLDAYDIQVGGNHYKQFAIQPHEFIVKNGIGWSAGNAIKYLARHPHKGKAEDVKKAIHYCMMLLKEEYGIEDFKP
jgi:hypothetical protein